MPPLENLDDFPSISHTSHTHGGSFTATATAFPQATQQELLATANELYKQIEQAAAAALASGPANGNGGTTPGGMGVPADTDDAYWLSLPAHLRSFIKNALPLAAGLTPPGSNSTAAAAHALNLSPEQMHQAAQQLAQVVQSTGWASLGVNGPRSANAASANGGSTTTTTIPLGSFTLPLPLPTHPDHVPANKSNLAQAQSAEYGLDDYTDEDEPPVPVVAKKPAVQQQKAKVAPAQPNIVSKVPFSLFLRFQSLMEANVGTERGWQSTCSSTSTHFE
jgi:hypothetical protein